MPFDRLFWRHLGNTCINLRTLQELVNRLKKLMGQKESKLNQIEKLKSKIEEYERKNTRMEQFRLEHYR